MASTINSSIWILRFGWNKKLESTLEKPKWIKNINCGIAAKRTYYWYLKHQFVNLELYRMLCWQDCQCWSNIYGGSSHQSFLPGQDLDPVLDLDSDTNEVKYSLANLFWNRIQGAYIYLFNCSRDYMKMIIFSLQNLLVASPLSHTPMDGLRQKLVTSSKLNIWSRYAAFLFSL